jgi:hypothetical protein
MTENGGRGKILLKSKSPGLMEMQCISVSGNYTGLSESETKQLIG